MNAVATGHVLSIPDYRAGTSGLAAGQGSRNHPPARRIRQAVGGKYDLLFLHRALWLVQQQARDMLEVFGIAGDEEKPEMERGRSD
ncbi:MAG TPA: hypothetical protein VIG44_10220 [Thermomicrobiales bacterium]